MSKLKLRGQGKTFELNVYQFSAPLNVAVVSVQVQAMQHHHPIKVGQPDLLLEVVFATPQDKNEFQDFVRAHQMNALMDTRSPEVRLWWPDRDIVNWSGYIVSYKAGSERFAVVPHAQFGIKLVDSMVSDKTRVNSYGSDFVDVLGAQVPAIFSYLDDAASLIPPAPVGNNSLPGFYGGGGTF